MLHYVHQLDAYCVCLQFWCQTICEPWVFRAFSMKTAAYCGRKRHHESGDGEPKQLKNELKLALMLCEAKGSCGVR